MIYNEEQYIQFRDNLENYENYLLYDKHISTYCILAILNDFLLKRIMKENDEKILNLLFGGYCNDIILQFLLKYNIISKNVFNLFYTEQKYDIYELINYFYFNKEGYYFNNNFENFNLNKEATLAGIIINKGYDINMLKYLSNRLKHFKKLIPLNYCKQFRIPLHFPLKIVFQYFDKIYESNNLMFIDENKNFEYIINKMFTDNFFYEFLNDPLDENNLFKSDLMYGKLSHSIYCKDTFKDILNRYGLSFEFYEKIILKVNNINKKYDKNLVDYYNESFSRLMEIKYTNFNLEEKYSYFEKLVLNDRDEIEKLLNDPDYIFNIGINFMDFTLKFYNIFEMNIIYSSFLVSLIHNNYNDFIIHLLCSYVKDVYMTVKFENDKLIFYYSEIAFDEDYKCYEVYEILSNTPHKIFNSYIGVKLI